MVPGKDVSLSLDGLALVPHRMFWATFALVGIAFGVSDPPVVYPPLFALPGFAAVAGLASIAIGVAPRRAIARLALGARAYSE